MTTESPPIAVEPAGWLNAETTDTRALRDLFGTFLTGVTVVTTRDETGAPRGFTANSFTSVSLDPPLVLICVGNAAGTFDALCQAPRFGVNVLAETQHEVSAAFAGRHGTKFDGIKTWSRPGGAPLIEGCLGTLDCAREQVVQAGDHAIVIGRVLGFSIEQGQPLGYFRGGYTAVAADIAVLERQGAAMLIGALIEHESRILLRKRMGQSHWEFPTIPLRHGEDHRQALPRLFEQLGLKAQISALYSVFQESGDPHTLMLFRGEAIELPASCNLDDGSHLGWFSEADEPWSLVAGRAHAEVLARFFRERASAKFGIYWDTSDGGQVAAIDDPHRWTRAAHGAPS